MCAHPESEILLGCCMECSNPADFIRRAGDFIADYAPWVVIAAAAVMFAANLWYWYTLDFRIVG